MEDLSRKLHRTGFTNDALGAIGRMQHTVLARYEDKLRRSGAPAHTHFFVTQYLLAILDFGLDAEQIGLGHDLIEDGVMTAEEVADNFGGRVNQGILALSKLPAHKADLQLYFDQIVLCGRTGIWEVIPAKLADRGHNLRTLYGFSDPEREVAYLMETWEYVYPLVPKGRDILAKWAPDKIGSYDRLACLLYREYAIQAVRLGVSL
jgi:GTP pyrophosphokinase